MQHVTRNATSAARKLITKQGSRSVSSRASVPKSLGGQIRNDQPVISVFSKESNETWCQTRAIAGWIAGQATFSLIPVLERIQHITGKPLELVQSRPTRQHTTGSKEVGTVAMHASQFSLSINESGTNKDLFTFLHKQLGNALFTEMPAILKTLKIASNYSAMIGIGTQPQNLTEYQIEAVVRSEIDRLLVHANRAMKDERSTKSTIITDLTNATTHILCPSSQAIYYDQQLQTKATWPTTPPITTSYTDPTTGLITLCLTDFYDHDGKTLAQLNQRTYDKMNPNLLIPYSNSSSTPVSIIVNELDRAIPIIKKSDKSKGDEKNAEIKPL